MTLERTSNAELPARQSRNQTLNLFTLGRGGISANFSALSAPSCKKVWAK
jgi:hypothetical protein